MSVNFFVRSPFVMIWYGRFFFSAILKHFRSSDSFILILLKAKSIEVSSFDFIIAVTFFLSTSSIAVISVSFSFRNLSIFSRNVLSE